MESSFKNEAGKTALVLALLLCLACAALFATLSRRPGGGQGVSCSCGVVMSPVGAVSKCTCGRCKCKQ